jgi:hypothetical protein
MRVSEKRRCCVVEGRADRGGMWQCSNPSLAWRFQNVRQTRNLAFAIEAQHTFKDPE